MDRRDDPGPRAAAQQNRLDPGSPLRCGRDDTAGVLLALSISLAAAPALATEIARQTPEQQVAATLDAFHDAAARADAKAYFDLFTPDGVFIGTDVSERWTVPQFKAYAAPHFAKGKGWVYRARERHVTLAPGDCRCVAWFDEVLDSASYGTARGSGALVRGEDGWKVAHYVLSFPIPNDLADGFTEQIKAYQVKARP